MQKNTNPITAPTLLRMTPKEWNKTHRDFKGSVNGQRYVLQMTTRGTTMVPVEIVKELKK